MGSKFCENRGHRLGEVIHDEGEEPYTICTFPGCGEKVTLKQMTLADVDQEELKKVRKRLDGGGREPTEKGAPRPKSQGDVLCKHCKGKLFEVLPKREMDERVLHECGNCKEREYIKL